MNVYYFIQEEMSRFIWKINVAKSCKKYNRYEVIRNTDI